MDPDASKAWGSPVEKTLSKASGRGVRAAFLVGLLAALLGLFLTSVGAVPALNDGSVFEVDRDAVSNQGQGGEDWDRVHDGTTDALADTGVIADGTPDSSYFFQGSKDTLDLDDWHFATEKGGIPDKDEITNAYASAYAKDGQLFVYFGLDRYSNSGDAELGFWFFQDRIGLELTSSNKGDFTGRHSVGDVFVLANFTNGGAVSSVNAYRWVGGNDPLVLFAEGADCVGGGGDLDVCATVNQGDTASPWPYTPKAGSAGTFPENSFFEGAVNLSGLFGEDLSCFSSFLASTRASTSLTAELHDFALGSFGVCDARIKIDPPQAANQVGDEHPFTITVDKRDTDTGFEFGPAEGVDVTATIESGPGSFDDNTCTTAADGTCTVVLNSADAGVTTVSASADVPVAGGAIAVSTNGEGQNSGPAVKHWVDARLALTPPQDANQVGDTHTFTATLEFQLTQDGPFVAAPDGESISLAKVSGPGTLSDTSCQTVDGSCSVTLNSAETGLTTVGASWSGEIATAEGSATASATADDAVKRWVDARLAITPPQDTNAVGDDHTFTLDLDFDRGDGAGFVDAPAGETISISKDSGPGTLSASSCETGPDGTCTVDLSSPVTGLTTVSAAWTGEIATAEGTASASASSDDAVKRWVAADLTLTPPQDANEVGDTHTFTATLRTDVGAGGGLQPAAGETISISKDSGPGTLSASSCETGPDGTCTVDLSSSVTGLTTVSAAWTGEIATAEGSATASASSDDAIKRWVDADLSLTPPTAVNQIGDTHTFTATLRTDLGGGEGLQPAAGETISLAKASGPGTLSASSCETLADGTCTVDLDSDVTGLTEVEASWSGQVVTAEGTVSIDRSDDATKRWVDALILINPPQATNQVDTPHVFTITVKQGQDGVSNPAADVLVTTAITDGPGSFVGSNTCTTDAAGECTVTVESSETGLTVVSASATVTVDGIPVDVVTDGQGQNAPPAEKRWVDAVLTLTPPQAANQVGDPHTFTANLRIDEGDGDGFQAAEGEVVDVAKVSGPGTLGDSSCTTDADGSCDVVLTSDETGLSTVRAAWNGVIATAEGSTSASASSDDAVKRWVDARLTVTPPQATNVIEDVHTYTAALEIDDGLGGGFGPADAGEQIAFAKISGPGDFVDGVDSCTTVAGGTCTVDLVSAETGRTTVAASWTGEIATAQGTASARADSNDALKDWVDPAIQIVKTADPEFGPPRDVTYTYVVTNIGDVTLTNIDVDDDILGLIGTIDSLEPGESATLTSTVAVDENSPVRNVATACGDPTVDGEVIGEEVCDTDDAVIAVVLGAEITRLPRTGGGIWFYTLIAALLTWMGALSYVMSDRFRRDEREVR